MNRYSGFYQKAQVQATFLNSEVTQQILKKQLNQLQWSDETLQKEREKAVQKNASQTVFFLSFFTPEKELNDLNKGVSIWKLYLEIDGNRYEGKAKKSNNKYVDTKALFPYHNRWSFAYRVYFDIPLSAVENKNFKFVLTSSQGTSELVF